MQRQAFAGDLLPERSGTLPGRSDWHAVGQGTSRDDQVVVVQVFSELAIQGEAVGIHPKRDGGLLGVETIDYLSKLRPLGQRIFQVLAADGHDRLGRPRDEAIAKSLICGGTAVCACTLRRFGLASDGIAEAETADGGSNVCYLTAIA